MQYLHDTVVLTPPATMLLGDCRAELPKLDAASIDLIVTSPPYANQRAATYGDIKPNDYVDIDWHRLVAFCSAKQSPD